MEEELIPVIAADGRVTYLTISDIQENGFVVKNNEAHISNQEFDDLDE